MIDQWMSLTTQTPSTTKGLGVLISCFALCACGTSHLNCDTDENKALVKQGVASVVEDYVKASDTSDRVPVYPALTITAFNQHIVDVNAKQCDYTIDAKFQSDGQIIEAMQVSAVFRSVSRQGQTHEMAEFAVASSDSAKLGIAAVKHSLQGN